jgi:nucleoside-diphosphate-sugar epimerase
MKSVRQPISGYVWRALAPRLVAAGHDVVGLLRERSKVALDPPPLVVERPGER